MDEISKHNEIKVLIDEIVEKAKKFNKQSEDYDITNQDLRKIIDEYIELNSTFKVLANSLNDFYIYVNNKYNEMLDNDIKEQVISISKSANILLDHQNKNIVEYNQKFKEVYDEFDNIRNDINHAHKDLIKKIYELCDIYNDDNKELSNQISFILSSQLDIFIRKMNEVEMVINNRNESLDKTLDNVYIKIDRNKKILIFALCFNVFLFVLIIILMLILKV